MRREFTEKILLVLFVLAPFFNWAQHEATEPVSGEESKKEGIKAFIDHHLQDSYYFTLTEDEEAGVHYGIPLPVILWDNGLKVFSSSKFHHGEDVAEVDGNYYTMYHNKIYKTDAEGTITYDDHHHLENAKPLDFSITKNVVTMLLVSLLMFLLFRGLAKSYAANNGIPKGVGRFFEPLVVFVRDEIAVTKIGEKHYKK